MPIAFPMTAKFARSLEGKILVHFTKARFRDDIIVSSDQSALPHYANCTIHLKAGQGWSVAPFRLLRDYSVADPYLTDLKAYGRYTYFFLGEPGWWAVKKNIGLFAKRGDLSERFVVFRVLGDDVLKCAELLFYRPDDNVLVIRGDYEGPARVEPD